VNDPEVDGMIAQVMRQTDQEKINTLMRNIYTRIRSEHAGMPIVVSAFRVRHRKKLGKWNTGSVMYDLFFDELASGK
jgi:ABC-type transport system substrate-binding protein